MRQALYILGEFTDPDIDWLLGAGQRRELGDGSPLVRAGQIVDSLYFVIEGQLDVVIGGASTGGRRSLATLFPGEVIGELSFLQGRPPQADVIARGDAAVWEITHRRLRRQVDADPGFAARFYRALATFLADRLRRTTGALGFGPTSGHDDDDDLLADDALDTIELARRRFEWALTKMRGA